MENKVHSKQRVQFDFTPEALKRLENLVEQTNASSKAEVVRNALRVYEWLVTQVDPNLFIEVKDEKNQTAFRLPVRTLLPYS